MVAEINTSTIAALLRLGALAGRNWHESLQEILLVTCGVLKSERASYWRFREEPSSIVCELGYQATGERFERGFVLRESEAGPYFQAIKKMLVMAIDNARVDPRTSCLIPYLEARGIGSLLDGAIRTRGHGDPVGILCVERVGEPSSWSSQEQEFAFAITQLLSSQLEANARIEAENRMSQADILADVAAAIAEALDPQAAAQLAADSAVPRLAEWASVLSCDGKQINRVGEAHCVQIESAGWEFVRHQSSRSVDGPGVIARSMRERQTLFLPQVSADAAKAHGASASELAVIAAVGLRSMIVAPFIVRGEMTGAMVFATTSATYNQADLRFAERYAFGVAVLIENARLYQKAQEAIRARDDFLSLASHELRTPITSLRLFATRLAQKASQLSPTMVATLSNRILRQAARLERMAARLLDTCEIGGGRPSLERTRTDLGAIVDDVVQAFAESATRAGSELRVSVRGPVVGYWDPIRIEQIVANLIDNSIKFGHGSPIHIDVETRTGRAHLTIRDEGPGISKEDEPHLFDQYWRAKESRNVGGLGLGLFVVKETAEAHGGTVRHESNSGGATFTLELPLDSGQREHEPPGSDP